LFRGGYYRLVAKLYSSWGHSRPEMLVTLLAVVRSAGDTLGRNGRSRIYLGHLARIFPDRGAPWRRKVMREYWKTHQRAMLGLFHASEMDLHALESSVEWQGREHLDRALSLGKGVLLLAPHFGDERTMHIAMALSGYGMHVLSTDYADAPEVVRRARLGTSLRTHHLAFPSDSPRWMYRALEAGEIVQTAPTGYGGTHGVWVESFGVPVLAPATFHRLREATGCALMLAYNHALPGLTYRICLEPLELPGDRNESISVLFDRITALGREFPDQYNWMNLAIRHRETNTAVRLGFIPADERILEKASIRGDGDPRRICGPTSLPRSRRMESAMARPSRE